jgi:hypothetical protein
MTELVKLYGGAVTVAIDKGRHRYHWVEEDKPLDGVTSILRKTSDKSNLITWAGRCGPQYIRERYQQAMEGPDGISSFLEPTTFYTICEEAETAHETISGTAKDIGHIVHKFAETTLVDGGAAMPPDPQAAAGARAFLAWRQTVKLKLFFENRQASCERTIMSRKWYYAGTTDFAGFVDDELAVLDFKTSKPFIERGRPRGTPWPDQHKQLAAYAIALEEETGEQFKVGWIIRLDKETGLCEPYKIELNGYARDAWLRARELEDHDSKLEEHLNGLRKRAA